MLCDHCQVEDVEVREPTSCPAPVILSVAVVRQVGVDYRLVGSEAENATYFTLDEQEGLEALWLRLTKGGEAVKPTQLVIDGQGRSIAVPAACLSSRVARFSFEELCGEAKSAADYIAIAKSFHTVFITDVPQLVPLPLLHSSASGSLIRTLVCRTARRFRRRGG